VDPFERPVPSLRRMLGDIPRCHVKMEKRICYTATSSKN
jgi:hypothetical protein